MLHSIGKGVYCIEARNDGGTPCAHPPRKPAKPDMSGLALTRRYEMSASATLSLMIETGRKSALDLINDVAYYGNIQPFAAQADAKAWAQSISYSELLPMLAPYGADVSHALARYAKSETVTNGKEAMEKLVKRTFTCLGKVSIRHDARMSEPAPSNGIDTDSFSAREHNGIWGAFGFAPKATKEKSHVTDPVEETHVSHDDVP